jgi:hypothetical protein
MHHAKITASRAALWLGFAGLVALGSAIDRDPFLTAVGCLLVAAAMLLQLGAVLSGQIERTNRPADDAFVEGYEAGYDRGWRDGNDGARQPLALIPTRVGSADCVADNCDPLTQRQARRASN